MSATAQPAAGSPEAHVLGELMVAAGKAGQQYKSQVLGYVGTFDAKIENGIVVLEGDVEAKLPAPVKVVVQTLVGFVNTYIDANIVSLEGDAYDALCNVLISEGTKLQAS